MNTLGQVILPDEDEHTERANTIIMVWHWLGASYDKTLHTYDQDGWMNSRIGFIVKNFAAHAWSYDDNDDVRLADFHPNLNECVGEVKIVTGCVWWCPRILMSHWVVVWVD